MMKRLLPSVLAAGLLLLGVGAGAQTPNQKQGLKTPDWCGTTAQQEKYFAEHPGAREAQRELDKRLDAIVANQLARPSYVTDVTIPVVVHIIHGGGAENISDRQINSAIAQLNIDYQKLNPDTANTLPLFRPIAASVGFRFRLARKDPNGNCTNGITRHYLPNLLNDAQNGSIQATSLWDPSRYMNIWVVGSIGVTSPNGGYVAGYVTPPNDPSNPRDGFVVRSDFFGTQGTSSLSNTRAATHEIGHYFSLSHPWGQTNNPGTGDCSGTDFVADTPPTDGTQSCNLNYSPCGQVANVQNFMDYSFCFTMFTQGQRARMRALLAVNRTGLVSQANLVATGTDDNYVAPDCAPVASFSLSAGASNSVCAGSSVSFRDFSYNFTSGGGPLTYTWSFPGGTPATLTTTSATASTTYNTAGFYSVTLTVSNSVGSTSSTQTNLVKVEGPSGGETAPLVQSFEDPNFPNLFTAPTLRNYETSAVSSTGTVSTSIRWQRQAAFPAADGSAYLTVNDRFYPAGTTTTLITPNINLSGTSSSTVVRFARAYAARTATSDDALRVSFSRDCGVSWSTPTVFTPAQLSTQGATPIDGFVPASAADWADLTVAIPAAYQGSGLFKIRFQMVNGTTQGNNFYLDNLRVSIPLATKANALASRGISVFPNPFTNETAVHLALTAPTEVQLHLTDVLGREVFSSPAKTYGAGQLALPVQVAGRVLPAGVYVVRISLNGETFSSKLTVN